MHDKLFDRIIRDRLRDVGAGHQPTGWAYLERRLNAESAAGPETGDAPASFDEAIRQKLQAAASPGLQPDWEAMEEKLDLAQSGTPEPNPESFDEIIFQKLRHFQAPFRRQHWSSMADKLDREFVNAGSVWRSKVLELGLLSLLVFTFWQHFNPLPSPDPMSDPALAGEKAVLPATPPFEASGSEAEASRATGAEDATNAELSDPGLEVRDASPSSASSEALLPSSAASIPPSAPALPVEQARSGRPGALSALAVLPAPSRVWSQAPEVPFSPGPGATVLTLAPERMVLAFLPPVEAGAPVRSFDPPQDLLATPVPVEKKAFIHVGMFGSVDYNRIISPSARFFDARLGEFDRYELGYSGGLHVGFDLGQWEVQTGAVYSSKAYRPLQAEFWDGAFEEGYAKVQLKDIQLNVVQVPLWFRYNLLRYDRWRFYMMAGGTVHIAVSANYYYDNIGSPDQGVLEPNRGWFDGGTFRENSYVTGNVGVGLERFMTSRWSLFAQPTYQHAIDLLNHGMGPTRDRISTMSIFTGIRVRLDR